MGMIALLQAKVPIMLPIVLAVALFLGYATWVYHSRESVRSRGASEASIVGSSSQATKEAFDLFDVLWKKAAMFVKEASERVEELEIADKTRSVLDRISVLRDILHQTVNFSEVHLNAFMNIWRDTLKLGIRLSKEVGDLKQTITELKEMIKTQGGRITGQQTKITNQGKKILELQTDVDGIPWLRSDLKHLQTQVDEIPGLRSELKDVRSELKDVGDRLIKLQRKKNRFKEELRYWDWVRRCNQLAAKILAVPWEKLADDLNSEDEKFQDPWKEREVHQDLHDKVLEPKLKLDNIIWELSTSYQRKRNKKVHNRVIRKSIGYSLRRLLCKDFHRLERTSFTAGQKSMLREVLQAIHRYYFLGYSITQEFVQPDLETDSSSESE